MKKYLLMLCMLLSSLNTAALELDGIRLPDMAQVGETQLQLNGAGIRTKWFFKVYVGALYLTQKQTSAETVISENKEHRIGLHLLRKLKSAKLYGAFREGIEANNSSDVLNSIDAQMKQMAQIFESVDEVKEGDVVTLDYLPGTGTIISVNGTNRGTIAGEVFNRAILKIWLGMQPAQEDLKKGMLGG